MDPLQRLSLLPVQFHPQALCSWSLGDIAGGLAYSHSRDRGLQGGRLVVQCRNVVSDLGQGIYSGVIFGQR